jgi:hypothetical protein
VHPQQRPSFLIQRRLRPHPPTAAERDSEAPHPALLAAGFEVAEATQIHLRLFAGCVSNRRTAVAIPAARFGVQLTTIDGMSPFFVGATKRSGNTSKNLGSAVRERCFDGVLVVSGNG